MASSKVLEIIVKAKDQASKSFDEISKNSKKLEDSLKNVKKYSGIATTALVGLGTVMVKQATDIEPVRNAFVNLSKTIGESSEEMLKSLKESSKGAVSEYDLMLSANRAMKLGVTDNMQDMNDLMKIARLYGQQMGQDVTQSFNDIVTGLGRGSPMILDNLGIIIDSEKAYEEYAQTLGKTANELTKQEKTQALVNATLVEGRKALDEFGEPAQTMGERLAELKNSFTEMGTKIGTALLPVLEKILTAIQPIIDKMVDRINANPELAAKILMTVTAISGLIFVLSSVVPAITTVIGVFTTMGGFITGTLIPAVGGLTGVLGTAGLTLAVWGLRKGLSWLEDKIVSTDEKIEMYKEQIEILDGQLQAGIITQDQYNVKVAEYNQKILEAQEKSRTFGQYLKDELNETLQMITFQNGEFNEGREATKTLMQMLRERFGKVADRISNVLVKSIDSAIDRLRELWKRAQKVGADVGSTVSNAWSSAKNRVSDKISGFANGGQVKGNVPILVGERGPELFVPRSSGTIVPNENITNNNGITVNISGVSVRNETDIQEIANEMIRQIKLEKNFGIV